MLAFSTQCTARLCHQCQRDTEFYCNTCKIDLCLRCKEKHVINLDTGHHDVVIYREKYENLTKQETCEKHPNSICEMYCLSCEIPVCVRCEEHRKTTSPSGLFQHAEHKLLDIRAVYKTSRSQTRGIIQRIRSETLLNIFFILEEMKADVKLIDRKILSSHSEMLTRAQGLKNQTATVMYEVKIRKESFIRRLPQQKLKMVRCLVIIEEYEYRFEQLTSRPVELLFFLKKTPVPKTDAICNCTLLSTIEEINMEDLKMSLSEIPVKETKKRQLTKRRLSKIMSSPVYNKTVTVPAASGVYHISCLTSGRVWISDWKSNNIILTNITGAMLFHLTDSVQNSFANLSYGVHTVNVSGELIYIDSKFNIRKLSAENIEMPVLIEEIKPWKPYCVFSSPLNGDLLVGILNTQTYKGKVTRYSNQGKLKQTIPCSNNSTELYRGPSYITENKNGDIAVSDVGAVVVTDREGRYRFSYRGHPTQKRLTPRGICTDALSHILICDEYTSLVHMIDKDGNFLSHSILTQQLDIIAPYCLSYDEKSHFLWIGSLKHNRVSVYKCKDTQLSD
ncbi:uncharacterized protein LOC134228649, partial [Saccostrea cucullata]|uniref:uncharacterized protein LOC134228649 n=1 Tax=Saccostrea cuccullata TaxID=36930 RepID=UPI002ED1073A